MYKSIPTLAMMFLSTGLFGVSAGAQSTPAVNETKPVSRLTTARTVRAAATFSVMDQKAVMHPLFGVTITVAGPQRYRIDAAPLAKQAKAVSFFMSDGKKQYEYNSLQGKYHIFDMPKPGERVKSQLYSMAGLALILTPDAPPRPGVTRTTGEETLDGKKMLVTTDLEPPRSSPTQGSFSAGNRTWRDAKTGLPYRQSEIVIQNGVTRTNLQLDFTKWTFDEPVPAKTFAWIVPAGATAEEEALLRPGAAAPDFTVTTAEGKTVHLSDYKGKIVVLDFWATWCGPCQRSMPHLQKVYEQVKDKGVEVLGLCVWDERKEYDKWLTAKKSTYTFTTAFDPAGRADNNIAKKLYLVSAIPTQYVIDKEGKVAAAFVGYNEGDTALEATLQRLHVDIALPTTEKTISKSSAP